MLETFLDDPIAIKLVRIGVAVFFSILFLQSGFDKVFNFRENLSSISSVFKETFLKATAPLLFIILTLFEMMAGIFSTYGVIEIIIHDNPKIALYGALFSMASLISLFFGQRIAKDYGGAVGITSYFTASILAILILS